MNIKELIDDIAKEHHIILDRDDPIFISVTLNEKILQLYVEIIDDALKKHYDNLNVLNHSSLETARENAKQLITQTTIYMSDNLNKSLSDTHQNLLKSLKNEVEKIFLCKHAMEESRKKSFYFACTSVSFALMSMIFFLSKLF